MKQAITLQLEQARAHGNSNQVAGLEKALSEAMIASRSAVKRPKMGFTMPKKHVLAISAVVVVAVAAAWLIPGRSKAPTTAGAPTEQAQLPLGKPTPNVEFANSGQPTNLPMVGQPVMRGPLAEEAGGISEGDDGVPVEGSSATPPTVTTTAPPAGVPAGQPAAVAKPTPAPTVATAKPAPVTKPKVVVLMLITSLVGMFLATRAGVPWTVLVFGNLGIALCAGGAAAVNHVVDRRIDAVMARTHKRPLAEGRVSPLSALAFALFLAVAGLALLLAFTNPLAAWLTLASLLGYAVIYTGFLKRATPQNIVIGGLAGAAPPLLGWVAVTGHVSAEPLLLVLIIFA